MKTFLDGRVTLHGGDCLEVVKGLADNSIDSVVTDPPYALTSIVARYGNVKSNLEQPADKDLSGVNAGAFRRLAKGFMGKVWDTGDVAFAVEFWAEILRVLKPGGHVAAFGGTRSYHRLACAIEDAGFEIRDQLAWCYGTGFPKSHDVSKGIDKRGGVNVNWFGPWLKSWRTENNIAQKDVAALFPSKTGGKTGCVANWELGLGLPTVEQFNLICLTFDLPFASMAEAEREIVGKRDGNLLAVAPGQDNDRSSVVLDITAPATDAARQWEGWGTALKPSYEPIVLGSKPLQIEQHIAILVQELTLIFLEAAQWSNCNAPNVENHFLAILAKCEALSTSVLASARIRSLESIGIAKSAARSSISNALASIDLIRTKDCSALSHVAQFGSAEETPDQQMEVGRAADFLKRLMDISTSAITEGISENTVKSWATISEDLLSEASKFTISTATKLTIALRTLNCSMLPSISEDTGRLTPNWQPICLARKPLSEKTVAANVLRWGTGAINVDGCRVEATDKGPILKSFKAEARHEGWSRPWMDGKPLETNHDGKGRFPANLCHDGSDEVLAAFPETGASVASNRGSRTAMFSDKLLPDGGVRGHSDNGGSAARFYYSAKASKADRALSKHPTVKPVKLMQWLVRLITPPGGITLDPFSGTGTTGEAAWREGFSAVLIEREEEYQADIERRMLFARAKEKPDTTKRAQMPETLPLPLAYDVASQATLAAE